MAIVVSLRTGYDLLEADEMNYSKSLLLYEDKPSYGRILRLIVLVVPLALLAAGILLGAKGDFKAALTLLVESLVISLIFWSVFPRSYRVYEDHLRIVLGGPFSIKINFDQMTGIEITTRTLLTSNFVTRFTNTYVVIKKKKGMPIAITPNNNELFIENAGRALAQWKRTVQSQLD